MQSIKKSECPKELEPADRRSAVNVSLMRRDENFPVSPPFINICFLIFLETCCSYPSADGLNFLYSNFLQEPEKPRVPFQGVGRTLGSSSSAPETEPSVAPASLHTAPSPSTGLIVDEALPSTSIQLRLSDGTRMIAHFNYHHTISDIRAFIEASRPGGSTNYQLQVMGFPPKALNDPSQTVEQAGLANSVVIQKF